MLKKLICILLALAACAAAALYFYQKKSTTIPHENLIPDDATAVVIADAPEFIKEAGIKLDFTMLFKEKRSAGVDFTYPVYAFLTKDGNVGLAAVLSDSDELEEQLEDVRKSENLTWGMAGGMLVCHDGNRMLMLGLDLSWEDKKAQQEMVQLMNKQFTESFLFEDLTKRDGAIKAKFDLAIAESLLSKTDMAHVKTEVEKWYKDYAGLDTMPQLNALYLDMSVAFTKNSIALSTSLSSPDEQTAAFLNSYKEKLRPINHKLDAHIPEPEQWAIWMCLNMNGTELLNSLKKDKNMEAQLKAVESFMNVSNILTSLNGDMVLLYGGGTELALVTQVDNTKFLTPQLKEILSFIQIRTGNYEDKSFYVTNSPYLQTSMKDGGYKVPEEDGYNDDCVFFLTMYTSKTLAELSTYVKIEDESDQTVANIYNFLKNDVNRINLRATQDAVMECKVFLHNEINDYVSKWTE